MAAGPAPPLSIPRRAVRALLMLIQVSYLVMYGPALYKFHDVLRVSHELYGSPMLAVSCWRLPVLCVPVRLYLFTALAFDYPDLGVKSACCFR